MTGIVKGFPGDPLIVRSPSLLQSVFCHSPKDISDLLLLIPVCVCECASVYELSTANYWGLAFFFFFFWELQPMRVTHIGNFYCMFALFVCGLVKNGQPSAGCILNG